MCDAPGVRAGSRETVAFANGDSGGTELEEEDGAGGTNELTLSHAARRDRAGETTAGARAELHLQHG